VKQCTLTLLGVPTISISVVPLAEKLPLNVMNIPLISTWISNCISTAVAEYVAPKSLNLDLQRLIVGDDVKKGGRDEEFYRVTY
jgi:Ca2+-dependent lipid-binding protein